MLCCQFLYSRTTYVECYFAFFIHFVGAFNIGIQSGMRIRTIHIYINPYGCMSDYLFLLQKRFFSKKFKKLIIFCLSKKSITPSIIIYCIPAFVISIYKQNSMLFEIIMMGLYINGPPSKVTFVCSWIRLIKILGSCKFCPSSRQTSINPIVFVPRHDIVISHFPCVYNRDVANQ